MKRTPSYDPKPNHSDCRQADGFSTQGKPPAHGDSVLPHPMKIPGETQDMWHAGEYENGMGSGTDYDR